MAGKRQIKQVESATFREMLKQPSAALQAMVSGLLKQSRRTDFKISMSTYGAAQLGVCFGCAATCAVQEAANVDLTSSTILPMAVRVDALGVSAIDCWEFELAIDNARCGRLRQLFEYFKLPVPSQYGDRMVVAFAELTTENWRKQLPAVRRAIEELRKSGH